MKPLFAAALIGLLPGLSFWLPVGGPASAGPAVVAPAPDSTTVRLLYGVENADLTQLMERVLHVEKNCLLLHDRRLAGRRLRLTLQEYLRGVPGPEKPMGMKGDFTRLDSAGRLAMTVYARPASETTVENTFILPRATMPRSFAAVPGKAGNYSMRFDIHRWHRSPNQAGAGPNSPVQEFRLPLSGPATVLAVYTLPYEKEGISYYCGLAQSHVPVAEWYSRFGVPHYVVYRVQVE